MCLAEVFVGEGGRPAHRRDILAIIGTTTGMGVMAFSLWLLRG